MNWLLCSSVVPIMASDRWYSCAPFLLATQGLPFDKLLRLKRDGCCTVQVLATGKRRPRRWGAGCGGDPGAYQPPMATRSQQVMSKAMPSITWWTGLHLPKERVMHELDNRKDQIMTVCKLALANLAMWVRDRFFPSTYAHATWLRLQPFFACLVVCSGDGRWSRWKSDLSTTVN